MRRVIVWRVAMALVVVLLQLVLLTPIHAQSNTIGFPPSSTCGPLPPNPIKAGTNPGYPGHWWNVKRVGTGWDFYFSPDNPGMIDVIWLTFDGKRRPTWLSNGGGNVQTATEAGTGAKQYWMPLYTVTYNSDGTTTYPVPANAQVAITFVPGSTTQAAIRWSWTGAPAHPDECVNNFLHGPGAVNAGARSYSATTPMDDSFTGNWFSSANPGWGFLLTIGTDSKPNPKTIEVDEPVIYDTSGYPIWLFGQNPDAVPVMGSTTPIPVTYARSLYSQGFPTEDCTNGCFDTYKDPVTQKSNAQIVRTWSNSGVGSVSITASIPAGYALPPAPGVTPSAAVDWPNQPHTFTNPQTVNKLTDLDLIAVNQSVCQLTANQTTCPVIVAWGSSDATAQLFRRDLVLNVLNATPVSTNFSGQITDNLPEGSDVQYETHRNYSSTGPLLFTSSEVKVLPPPLSALPSPILDTLPANQAGADATPGKAGMSGGAATYTMPISVPPGRAGMQPSLSLDYNSRGGSGIAGIGWSLGGLSSVHRCPQTPEQDGAVTAVSYTLSDRLCLDGQRLVLASGTTYGASGAEYRTEVNSYARIYQVGGALSDPTTCFRVEQKDGQILHYGGLVSADHGSCTITSANSRVKPEPTKTLSWLVEKVEDRVGNTQLYSYSTFGNGETLPNSIVYAGSAQGPGNRAVVLSYGARPSSSVGGNDVTSSYLAGYASMQTVRLTQIATYTGFASVQAPGSLVRTYALTYNNGSTAGSIRSGRSLLTAVTECSYIGGSACRNTSGFLWNGADAPTDFIAHQFAPSLPPALSQTSTISEGTTTAPLRTVTIIGDVDGDGSRETLVVQKNQADGANHSYLVKYNADRTSQGVLDVTPLYDQGIAIADPRIAGDVGGDGHADFVAGSNGYFNVYSWNQGRQTDIANVSPVPTGLTGQTGNTWFRTATTPIPFAGPTDQVKAVADFDGDGYADVLVLKANSSCAGTLITSDRTLCLYTNATHAPVGSSTTYLFSSGTALDTLTGTAFSGRTFEQATDINGDGIPDIFVDAFGPNGTALHHILVSVPQNGSMSGCTPAPGPARFVSCPVSALGLQTDPLNSAYLIGGGLFAPIWMDVNGDGLVDLVIGSATGCSFGLTTGPVPRWCIQLNTGKGFGSVIPVTWPGEVPGTPYTGKTFGLDVVGGRLIRTAALPQLDVDATGKAELIYPDALAVQVCYQVSVPPQPTGECTEFGNLSLPGNAPSGASYPCVYNVCSADPSGARALPILDGQQSKQVGATIGGHGPYLDDFSVYRMKALRFVQDSQGAYAAVPATLDTSTTTRPTHEVLAALSTGTFSRSDDLFGDGLPDLLTTIGCTYGTQHNSSTNYDELRCRVIPPTTSSCPSSDTLPDGTNQCALQNGSRLYVNENVGAGARNNDTLAPTLPELIFRAFNALGDYATWDYFPLSSLAGRSAGSLSLYTIDSSFTPDDHYFYFESSMPVVSTMMQSNGIGGTTGIRSESYAYGSAIYNHLGRGFQGFQSITMDTAGITADRNTRTKTTYNQKFPLSGKVSSVVQSELDTGTVFKKESDYWVCDSARGSCPTASVPGQNKNYTPLLDRSVVEMFDLGTGVKYAETDTNNYSGTAASGWDPLYGNLAYQVVQHLEFGTPAFLDPAAGHTVTITNSYSQDLARWFIDKLNYTISATAITYSSAGHPFPGVATELSKQARTDYIWNDDRTLNTKTIQNGVADQWSTTTYAYPSPSYGLPSSVSVTANGLAAQLSPTRTTSYTYTKDGLSQNSDGYFVYQTTNALNQTMTQNVRIGDGKVTLVTDPNSIKVQTAYDVFGHVTQISHLDRNGANIESPIQTALVSCLNTLRQPNHCPVASGYTSETGNETFAAYLVATVQAGYPTQLSWRDMFGREIKHAERGYTSTAPFTQTLTHYDEMGAVSAKFAPFFKATPSTYFSSWDYDALNRVVTKSTPASDMSSCGDFQTDYVYNGRTTFISAHATGTCTCTANTCVTMSRSTNALGEIMQTTDSAGGITNYWTEPLGKVAAITDAGGSKTIANYDPLGRRIKSADPDQGTWTFGYDAFGDLRTQTDARLAVTTVTGRDLLGRLQQQQVIPPATIPLGMATESIQDDWSYDPLNAIGHLGSMTRRLGSNTTSPSSNAVYWSESYQYDPASTRQTAVNTTLWGGAIPYTATMSYDSYGRLDTYTYPDGLAIQYGYGPYGQFGSYGNKSTNQLYWKATAMDAWGKVTGESFVDGTTATKTNYQSTGQDQTATWAIMGNTIDSLSYTYDSFGNLRSQSRSAEGASNSESYTYDALQRLSAASRTVGLQVKYGYAANGNLLYKTDFSTDTSSGGTQAYTYAKTGSGCGPHAVTGVAGPAYTYTCDKNGNVVGGNTITSATFSVDNKMENVKRNNCNTTWSYGTAGNKFSETTCAGGSHTYLSHGYELINTTSPVHELGPITLRGPGSASRMVTMVRDRLGSVIDAIDGSAAKYANARAYDAFGAVRNGDLSSRTNGTLNLSDTVHGFTDHDQADSAWLTHMGGRVYDYQLGRFLSVDPIIDNPANSQSVNPYSYVGNNPLSGTDPTGYQAHQARPCNGDQVCITMQSGAFLGGAVAERLSGLQYGGAAAGWGVGSNGYLWQGTQSVYSLAGVAVGATTDLSTKSNSDTSGSAYNGGMQPFGTIEVNGPSEEDWEDYRKVYPDYYNGWAVQYKSWYERENANQMARGIGTEFFVKPIAFTLGGIYFGAAAADVMYLKEGAQVGLGAAELGDVADTVPAFSRSQYGRLSNVERSAALEKSPTCPYCGKAQSTQADHITSLKQDWQTGGWADSRAARTSRVNTPENVIGACGPCNASKGAREIGTGAGQWQPPGWQLGEAWPYGGPH